VQRRYQTSRAARTLATRPARLGFGSGHRPRVQLAARALSVRSGRDRTPLRRRTPTPRNVSMPSGTRPRAPARRDAESARWQARGRPHGGAAPDSRMSLTPALLPRTAVARRGCCRRAGGAARRRRALAARHRFDDAGAKCRHPVPSAPHHATRAYAQIDSEPPPPA